MGRFVGFPAWETIKATQVEGRLPQTPQVCALGSALDSSLAQAPRSRLLTIKFFGCLFRGEPLMNGAQALEHITEFL